MYFVFRHQWNLNNLPYNYSSILKYLGPVPGKLYITSETLSRAKSAVNSYI